MKHKYISYINFEYYWFNNIYVSIQEKQEPMVTEPYAIIRTEQSSDTKQSFDYFEEKGMLQEISKTEFDEVLGRAIYIIKQRNK